MKKLQPHCDQCNTRNASIFCHLDGEQLKGLDEHKNTRVYRRGEFLFQEGQSTEAVFCIRSGRIKLFKGGPQGQEVITGIAKSSDVLGFRSAFSNLTHRHTAQILEDAQVCVVQKDFFTKLVQQNQDLTFQILQKLTKELEATESRLSEFLNMDVRTRLVRLLLILKQTYGVDDMTGSLLNIRLTRQEMGEMIGAASETVIRLLSDLERDQLIAMEGRKIKITDQEGLAEIACFTI